MVYAVLPTRGTTNKDAQYIINCKGKLFFRAVALRLSGDISAYLFLDSERQLWYRLVFGTGEQAHNMHFLYSLALTLAAILSSPYWLVKGLKQRKYLESVPQRLGRRLPADSPGAERPLWLHAVSVGEVLTAKNLLATLRARRPDLPIVVSTVTSTGRALAMKELSQAAEIFYFPFDWDFSVRCFLDRLRPRAVVLMETELWPNFLRRCSQRAIPVLLINGRLSDKSFRRYRCMGRFTGSMLQKLTAIGVQTEEYRARFLELGAADQQIRVTGNLKFDCPVPEIDQKGGFLRLIRAAMRVDVGAPLIVVGSSMKGEEGLLLGVFRTICRVLPEAGLVLAPRHPERFDEVADLIQRLGISFQRRSRLEAEARSAVRILLLDTIGELRAVYSLASVAVIGGSFLPFGGHNPLEPAAFGKAIVFGPDMSNFKDTARVLLGERAARQCSLEALPDVLIELLRDSRAREELGRRAAVTLERNQGATERTLELVLPQIS
jgi:3-deoxy-D-manno-octulosonic-acid transferase